MHASYLARDLGLRRVLVPFLPGAFSAYGVLVSDVRLDFGRTRVTPIARAAEVIEGALDEFTANARSSFAEQGFDQEPILAGSADLRYVGQSYEVNVPVGGDLAAAFLRRHAALYGYASVDEPVELVTVRLAAVIPRAKVLPPLAPRGDPVKGERSVAFPEGREDAVVYDRAALPAGFSAAGPAIVEEDHATTVVPPGGRLSVGAHGILAVEVGP
jgi:N-methylhydantoinase A